MSLQWSFYTFRIDRFKKLCGSATAKQLNAVLRVLNDPREFSPMGDQRTARRNELVKTVFTRGLDYTGLSRADSGDVDTIVKSIFYTAETAKAVHARLVSGDEPMSLGMVDELERVAKTLRPESLLPIFNRSRRFGQTELSNCEYLIFNRDEIWSLYEDLFDLADDRSADWNYPEVPEIIKNSLLPVFEAASGDAQLWLYGNLS